MTHLVAYNNYNKKKKKIRKLRTKFLFSPKREKISLWDCPLLEYLTIYAKCFDHAISQLRAIETLRMFFYPDFHQEIQWSNLTQLSRLKLIFPPANVLTNMSSLKSSLTSLDLQWKHPIVFDFKELVSFSNMVQLTLATESRGNLHFDALFLLPKLKDLTLSIHLTTTESMQLAEWKKSHPSRRIKLKT
jgi:hypothetical protein